MDERTQKLYEKLSPHFPALREEFKVIDGIGGGVTHVKGSADFMVIFNTRDVSAEVRQQITRRIHEIIPDATVIFHPE